MARKIPSLKARRIYKGRLAFGLVLRPLRLFCDECSKYVPSNMEWRCGYCGHDNIATRIYSFLNKCKNCKREPKAYVCPHCGVTIFLDRDMVGSHPASKISAPVPPALPVSRDEIRLRRREDRDDAAEQLNHEIVIAKLNGELAKVKSEMTPASPLDKLEVSFANRKMVTIGVYQIAQREYALNAVLYKDNPSLREQADAVVKQWVEDHTPGM